TSAARAARTCCAATLRRSSPSTSNCSRSLRPYPLEPCVRPLQLPAPDIAYGVRHRARDVAHFLLHVLVAIELLVARRIRLVVADVAIEPRLVARIDESHPIEPVGKRVAGLFHARDVTVHDQAVHAILQMLRK